MTTLGVPITVGEIVAKLEDKNLDIAIQDANGDLVFSNTRAIMGFLEAKNHMLVSKKFTDATAAVPVPNVDLARLGKIDGIDAYLGSAGEDFKNSNPYLILQDATALKMSYYRMTVMNYLKVKSGGLSGANSYVIGALRARWALFGALKVTMENTNDRYEEHSIIDVDDPVYGDIEAADTVSELVDALGNEAIEFYNHHSDEQRGAAFVTKYADAIWSCTEHLFRVRGHHYKNSAKEAASYADFVDRYMSAFFEGEYAWPNDIDKFHVFHTAIHPFKVRALPVITAKLAAHGTLANSAILRMNGAPVGTAVITTTAAALDTMRSEAWYGSFNEVYTEDIALLNKFSKLISDNKYGYHMCARLYGLRPARVLNIEDQEYLVESAKSRVSALAAAAQGMISALASAVESGRISGFSMSRAKALEKAAAANPLLTLRINVLVIRALEFVNDATSIDAAIKAALPKPLLTE